MEIVDGKPYIEQVRQRILEYATALGRDLSFQDIENELSDPAGKYTPPTGEILVAYEDGIYRGWLPITDIPRSGVK